jgi:hypothetical protein
MPSKHLPRREKTGGGLKEMGKKMSCKSIEQAENHKKGPGRSWARNQVGDPRLSLNRPFSIIEI